MKTVLLSALIALAAACQSDARSDPPRTTAPAAADYIRILAEHAERKPSDPVVVSIPDFRVVAADFDPDKIEGGTATLELDLSTISSGSVKRDNHLRSADYLDVARFGTATIRIDGVKRAGGAAYTADATVTVHGIEKTLPVRFEVLETLPDGIRVKGAHRFGRLDFGIGRPAGPDDSVGEQLTLELELTLQRT